MKPQVMWAVKRDGSFIIARQKEIEAKVEAMNRGGEPIKVQVTEIKEGKNDSKDCFG